MNDVLRK